MTVDEKALGDRLYADALSADLCLPIAFISARTEVTAGDIQEYVRMRGRRYCEELATSEAVGRRSLANARAEWQGLFGDGPWRGVALLARAAKSLLQPDGREMILRVDRAEPGREILRWRFVSLALPPSILIPAAADGISSPATVRLLGASIGPDGPVAQLHVHHAAMMSFEELWTSLRVRALLDFAQLVASVRDERAFCPHLHSGSCLGGQENAEREGGRKRPIDRARHMTHWASLVRQAFIARQLLARHVHHSSPLLECDDRECRRVARGPLRHFLAGRATPHHNLATPYPWQDERRRIERLRRTESWLHWRSGKPGADLIPQLTAEEGDLFRRAFRYLRPAEDASPDPICERLFMQYLRVKTAVFRLLVHPPGERGLLKFLDHFLQIKVYAIESDRKQPRRPYEPGLTVKATEYRVAPDAWLDVHGRRFGEVERNGPKEHEHYESGWVIHFKRKAAASCSPLFRSAIIDMESDADRIVRALASEPKHLHTLRGIDICGVEEQQPLWVSAETLRRVRRQSHRIAGRRPGLRLQPLHLTLHVGEDFRWLTSGVRAIAEPFHWHLIERGDRIGHGIALTLDPKQWWRRRRGRIISVKRIDRLLDLAFLAEYAGKRTAMQEHWLRREIMRMVKGLQLEPKHAAQIDIVEAARAFWRELGGRTTRRLMGVPLWRGLDRRPERWIHHYLWNPSTQGLAEELIELRVGSGSFLPVLGDRNECDLLTKARQQLIWQIARWQVCIESNPSSNLVVGGLDAMAAQFLQQRPTREASTGSETLTWTIGTDDPITFSTTLADEYAYAWAGMVLRKDKPYDPSYARALLDEAAATSMRMRFTIPRQAH